MGLKPRGGKNTELARYLKEHGRRPVDLAKLRRDIPSRIKIPKAIGPFLRAQELKARYGIPLPAALIDLHSVADSLAVEEYRAELAGWKYLRVGPGGWEPPTGKVGLPLLAEYVERFEWNAFSNMQFWEAFAGVVCLGWHEDGNRLYASIASGEAAPVLWMDHERGVLEGYVANSMAEFLKYCMGSSVPSQTKRAMSSPYDKTYRLELPPHQDPLHLQTRATWMLHLLTWATDGIKGADKALKKDRTKPTDYSTEEAALENTITAPAYWLFRSFFLGEDDLFDAAIAATKPNPSPLVQSLRIVLPERRAEKPIKSFLAKMRRRYSKARKK